MELQRYSRVDEHCEASAVQVRVQVERASEPLGKSDRATEAVANPQFHWYRKGTADRTWLLIETAQGTRYVPAPVDVGQNLMVVAVVKQNGQVKRIASTPIGPVQAP